MPGKRNQATLGQAVKETLKVFLLFRGEGGRRSRIESQLRFHARHPEERLGAEACRHADGRAESDIASTRCIQGSSWSVELWDRLVASTAR